MLMLTLTSTALLLLLSACESVAVDSQVESTASCCDVIILYKLIAQTLQQTSEGE